MTRFIDVDDSVVEVFLDVMENRFPSLAQLSIKLVFDTKRRIKEGKICLATTELASEKIKYFSKDNIATEGYDYVITIDQKTWQVASAEDKKRLMSHELRHVFIDEKGKFKIMPHDVSDFRAEMKLNEDDPDWSFKLGALVDAMYDQERDMAKQKKGEADNG
jgi:hypothetical protein